MIRKLILVLALIPVGVFTVAPGNRARAKPSKPDKVAQLGAPLAKLVTRANARGFSRVEAAPGNTVFSPAGELHALAPVALGAAGETRARLESEYGFPSADSELAAAVTGYFAEANRDAARYSSQTGFLLSGDFPPRAGFVENLKKLPGTELISTQASSGFLFGLIGGSDGFATGQAAVSDWLKRKSRLKLSEGEVGSLLPRSCAADSTWVFSSLNANYFKGEWLLRFEPSLTTARPFHADSSTRDVATMQMECDGIIAGDMLWLEPASYTAGVRQTTHRPRWGTLDNDVPASPFHQYLKLRFNDRRHAMIILLPKWNKASGESPLAALTALEGKLHGRALADTVEKICDDGECATVNVRLPKFSLRSTHDLAPDSTIVSAVANPWVADFSPMSAAVEGDWLKRKNVVLGSARQICEIEVHEDGAKAASVTVEHGVSIGCAAGAGPDMIYDFIADHPFLFALVDEQTGAVIFLGRVTELPECPAKSRKPNRAR